jgi:hypothetical protein
LSTPKLSKTEPLSDFKISDYAPTDSDANIVPFIKGEVVAESVKPYRVRKRLNDVQKVALVLALIFAIFAAALLLLPWALKFALVMGALIFIRVVSSDVGSGYTVGTGGGAKHVPGKAIVPFR